MTGGLTTGNRPVLLFAFLSAGVAIIWSGLFAAIVHAIAREGEALAMLVLSVAGFGVLYVLLLPATLLIAFAFRRTTHSLTLFVVWEMLAAAAAIAPVALVSSSVGRIANVPLVYGTQIASGLILGAALYWLYIVKWDPAREGG